MTTKELQIALEQKDLVNTISKAEKGELNALNRGDIQGSKAARELLKRNVKTLAGAIANGLSTKGKKPAVAKQVQVLGYEGTAYAVLGTAFSLLNKYGELTLTKLITKLALTVNYYYMLTVIKEKNAETYKEVMAFQRYLERNAKPWQQSKQMEEKVRDIFIKSHYEAAEDISVYAKNGGWLAARLLEASDYFEEYRVGDTVMVRLSAKGYKLLADNILENLSFYTSYLPMVHPPIAWKPHSSEGPYLTDNIYKPPFVRFNKHLRQSAIDESSLNLYMETANTLQEVPWEIDGFVLNTIKTLESKVGLRNLIPKSKMRSIHNDNGYAWFKTVIGKMEEYHELTTSGKIKGFYIPHNIDYRGRLYAIPFISYQGPDYIRGCLQFAEGMSILDEVDRNWLFIHCANTWGNDKVSFDERIHWVLDNLEALFDYAEDPVNNLGWLEADKPFQFLQAARDVARFMIEGYGYVSKVPVAIDGSCSGIQHYSAMTRDKETGALVNLTPAEKPQDIYQVVADTLKDKLKSQIGVDFLSLKTRKEAEAEALSRVSCAHKVSESELKAWLALDKPTDEQKKATHAYFRLTESWGWYKYGITRKLVKRAVMTFVYSSKERGFADQLKEDFLKPMLLSEAEQYFYISDRVRQLIKENPEREQSITKSSIAAGVLAKWLWETINEVIEGPAKAMRFLQRVAKNAKSGKENLPLRWVTPAGMRVVQQARKDVMSRVELMCNGERIQLVLQNPAGAISTQKQQNAIGPNFIHSMDASHLVYILLSMKDNGYTQLAAVHDAFVSPAGAAHLMHQLAPELMGDIYQVDWLNRFAQLNDQDVQFDEGGNWEVAEIKEALYAFA